MSNKNSTRAVNKDWQRHARREDARRRREAEAARLAQQTRALEEWGAKIAAGGWSVNRHGAAETTVQGMGITIAPDIVRDLMRRGFVLTKEHAARLALVTDGASIYKILHEEQTP